MTTIAYDGRCIAVDSQITAGETKYSARKVWEVTTPDGIQAVAFGCGEVADIQAAVIALRAGERLPKGAYTLVVYEFGGVVSEFNGEDKASALMYDHYAVGSGGQAALGALKMGASAARAVEVACAIDVNSGLPVVVFDTQTRKFRSAASRRGKTSP